MKPCDCKSIDEARKHLNEQGISFNDDSLRIRPGVVILKMSHTEIKLPMGRFKQFAEWFLEDQIKQKRHCPRCGSFERCDCTSANPTFHARSTI